MSKQRKSCLLYTVLFAAAAAGLYAGFFLDGRSLIWHKDAVGQYYPAFLYIGQYLRALFSGAPSLPLYDLSIGFGENIIGVLNYYGFGDPLNLFSVFAAGSAGVIVYEVLFFIRAFLAGLSLIAYLKRMGVRGWPAAVSAVLYALSAFTVAGSAMYAEWGSVLVYFPLMLLGAEGIMRSRVSGGRSGVSGGITLTAAVCYAALCGFYYLYMASLALAVYVIARLIARNGIRAAGRSVLTCLICLGHYVIGIFLAAPILLPAVDHYLSSQRSGAGVAQVLKNAAVYIPKINSFFLKALIMQPSNPEKTLLVGIPVLATAAVLLLIVLPGRILPFDRKRKELLAALILAVIALSLPLTGYLFNAFGETNDRWVFLIYFLFAVVTGVVLSGLTDWTETKRKARRDDGAKASFVFGGLVSVVAVLNIILIGFSLYGSGGYNWQSEFLPAEALNETYIVSPVSESEVIDTESETFRVSSSALTGINGRPENVAMLNDYNGVTYWWSVVNGRTQAYVNLVNSLGYRWRSFGLAGNAAAETLAGVRYYVTDDPATAPESYLPQESLEWNGREWQVFENPSFSGMAYLRSRSDAETAWAKTVGEGTPCETEDLIEMAHHRNPDDPWDKSGVDGSAFCAYLDILYKNLSGRADDGTPYVRASSGGVTKWNYDAKRNSVKMTVTVNEGDQLVTAIPYDKNWTAYVDGLKTAVSDADVMFLAVNDLKPGVRSVELVYRPRAFYAGLVLSAGAILLLILKAVLLRARRR